ncbi:MAG: hypothetical protein I3270_00500 [Candidatus Moeniiplasma glomeromycotorum]|nr:hypothetical protein [Candidatus Moeniiplasma glomeromycotorum]MCE8162227.1 hypothetical protein [Candidatus Moeniiplasma glomeromycotorum]MCE8166117.1 hypothetical protein [Candidatus Moeniiplasma glomeromycotorum]MCE8166626.1 hypothetical protein [Candidatus Moeniiplasma glomeromycotorum]
MAVPPRKKSSTRVKEGRGPKNLKFFKRLKNLALSLNRCKECKKMKRSHYQCLNCPT